MSKKKVTAPLTYDPGKGRPKEHLAYLNWQEMQALKRLNGNNQERGPMGLPSFPPGGTTGKSSAKSTGGKTTGKSTTKSSSPSKSSGPGGGMMGGSGSGGPSRTAPSKASSPSNNSGAGRQGGGGASRSVGGGSATRGAGPRSGVSGSRSPTSGSTKDSGKGPSMSKSPTRGLGETKLPSGGRTGFAGAGKNALSPKGGIGDLGGPKKDGQTARIKGAIESVKNAVAMDPSIPGRLARANENYKTVTAPGGMVTRVYSDPDIKKSTLGQTVSDAWKSTTDAISGWFNGPNLGNTPQEKAVAGFLKEAGMFPGPTTKKPIQDRIAPTPPSQKLYDPKYGPQLPTKAFYDRIAPTKPPTMPRQYAEKIYSPALSRTRVYDQPDLRTELSKAAVRMNEMAEQIRKEQEAPSTFNKYEALRAYKSPFGPELSAAVGSQIERDLVGGDPKKAAVSTPRASAEKTLRAYEEQKRLANPPAQKFQDRVPQTIPTSGVLNPEYRTPGIRFQEDKPTYSYDDSYMPPRQPAAPKDYSGVLKYQDRIQPTFANETLGYSFNPESPVQKEAIKTASLPEKIGKYDVYNPTDYTNSLAIRVPSPAQSLPEGYVGKAKTRGIPSPTSAEETILGVEDVAESSPVGLVGDEAIAAAKKAGIPRLAYEQPGFADDVNQLGIGVGPQENISPTDMAKLHSRAYGEGYLTPPERRQAAIISGLKRAIPAIAGMGSGAAITAFEKARGIESPKDFLSRPSYEQSYLRQLARAENMRLGRDPLGRTTYTTPGGEVVQAPESVSGPGRRIGFDGTGGDRNGIASLMRAGETVAPTPTESTTGTKKPEEKGPRPAIYYQWDLGINIPSPSDPNYTQYQTYLAERAAAQAAMYG